ncbi:MAG: hypothetical protein QM786_04910 [Breznakibacter sp.]
MKTKIHINPNFEHLRGDVESYLSTIGYGQPGNPSPEGRGAGPVKMQDIEVDVFWSTGSLWSGTLGARAKRQYNESLWLDANGIDVPKAIGHVGIVVGGMVRKSLFLSQHRRLETPLSTLRGSFPQSQQAVGRFARTMHQLHRLGVFGDGMFLHNLKFESHTQKVVWTVDGRLSVRHESVPSGKAVKDLEVLELPAPNHRQLIKSYLESAMESAYDSFGHWAFYQDIQKWADKQLQGTVWH